jgi:TRAP transporter TAXI family solute receptor
MVVRTRTLLVASALAALSLLQAGAAFAQSDRPLRLRLTARSHGSTWHVYAAGIAGLLRPELPSGSAIEVVPTAGAIENQMLIDSGMAELALAHSTSARWACRGEVAFNAPLGRLRGLVGGLDISFLGVFVGERSTITAIEQVRERTPPFRVIAVHQGSFEDFGARQILAAYGMSYHLIKQRGGKISHSPGPMTASALKNGNGVWFESVSYTRPIVGGLTTLTPLRLLPLSDTAVARLVAEGWERFVVPANSLHGQAAPVTTVSAPTNLLASVELPEPVAYAITKRVVEGKADLEKVHAALAAFEPTRAPDPRLVGCQLHPGAERYYREKGLLK